MRRFATGLALLVSILPPAVRATTAPSLSHRIVIDGRTAEYAHDEWVLDASTVLPEGDRDSAWGSDRDLARLALTWDHEFLYIAAEFRARNAALALFVANRPGGLVSLADAGEFRRAIELPGLPVNLVALAGPSRAPAVARTDASHPFGLVDRAAVPAAYAETIDGAAAFEMAIPWSALSLAAPVRIVAAITGATDGGAGDAAPDASAALSTDPDARAVLDRRLRVDADTDDDGVADAGVAPRAVAAVEPGADAAAVRVDPELSIDVTPRAIAPDRGDAAGITFHVGSAAGVYLTCAVYSIDGSRVRTLFTDEWRAAAGGVLAAGPDDRWDGTDDHGRPVPGGAHVVVATWGLARGERAGRATAAVVVAR